MEKTLLIGASGLAREVLAVTRDGDTHVVVGILDDDWADIGDHFDGVPVLGSVERAIDYVDTRLLICVGAGRAREQIVARLARLGVPEDVYTSVIDPSVRNPAGCRVGRGTILLANVVLTTAVSIGHHVVVMPNVTLTHDDVVGDFATIAAGAVFGGGVHIGRGAYVGMNASVRQRLGVGADSVLGMGAVLLESLPDGEIWAGVPAGRITVRDTTEALLPQSTDASSQPERSS